MSIFKYDKKRKELTISKIPVKEPDYVYKETDMYLSYKQYIDKTVYEDINEILIPSLNEMLRESCGGNFDRIKADNIRVVYDETSHYKGYASYSVFVTLSGVKIGTDCKEFCIFRIPYMDKFGLLKRDGKQYAVISELVQDDDFTFSDQGMKLITKEGCFINIKGSVNNAKMSFRKKDLSAYNVMLALATKEGIDGIELHNKLISNDLSNVYADSDKLRVAAAMSAYNTGIAAYVEKMNDPAYSISKIRNKLNKILSIDRALGETLSQPLKLMDGTHISAGSTITESIIRTLKFNRVNEVPVQDIPNMIGYFLADNVYLPYVRLGTEMIPLLKELIPEEHGMYASRDYDYTNELMGGLVIPAGTPVEKGLLEVLFYNGWRSVKLVASDTSTKCRTVPLERTIVGNNTFTEYELGIGKSNKYVYVNKEGELVEPSEYLTAYDLAAMLSLYDRLVKGKDLNLIADIDLGLRKKVNQANESFHKAFKTTVPIFSKLIKKKFVNMYKNTPQDLRDPDKMESLFYGFSRKWWSTLYVKVKVIYNIDMENPVSFYSSFNRINTIVKDKNSISMKQHSMAMGFYGRLCPYETPSGKTMGIVSNRANLCRIRNGLMETPYYEIKLFGKKAYLIQKPVYMTVEEEEKYRIADITSLKVDWSTGEILNLDEKVLARIPDTESLEKTSVEHIPVRNVKYVNVDPNQTDGIPATTIPFQGANDAARVVFGLGMCKQAKACVNMQIPIVGTSAFRDIPRLSTYYMINAEYDGTIVDVYDGAVVVYYPSINKEIKYDYETREFYKTTVIVRHVNVEVGQEVNAGDVLVSSNFIKDGYLTTGINCLVGYIPEGYNYEDGVYGSKRFAISTMSYGPNVEKTPIPRSYKKTLIKSVEKFKYNKPDSIAYWINAKIKSETVPVAQRSKKLKGFLLDVTKDIDSYTQKEHALKAEAISFDYSQCGDKFANRHGNKGVAPIIIDNNFMPRFLNGEFLDIVYNPAGVSSRMNIGQILECNIGLAAYVLDIRVISDPFNGAQVEDIKLLLSYAWHLANDKDVEAVFRDPKYACLGEDLHEHCRQNITNIKFWEGSFNEDGTAWLFNPRTGKYFETPVVVGVNYVYKLIHEVGKKAHARGGLCTEPYVEKLASPPKGSSHRGGQRFGYMEFDAVSAYGCTALLHEIQNERGDNPVARNNATVEVLHDGDTYKLDPFTGIRRSTEYFVNILEALGAKIDFEGELPNNTKGECSLRQVYKAQTLLKARDIAKTNDSTVRSLRSMSKELNAMF